MSDTTPTGLSRRSIVKGLGVGTAALLATATAEAVTAGRANAADPSVISISAAGPAQTLTWTSGSPWFDVTLTAPRCALTLPAPAAGTAAHMRLILRQDATGDRRVAWPDNVFSVGAIPPLSAFGDAEDSFDLFCSDGTNWILEGVIGPSNSLDPTALPGALSVVEAKSQPLTDGTQISSASPVTGLVDRSATYPLVAGTATPSTFHAMPSLFAGPLRSDEYNRPYLQLAAGATFSTTFPATDDCCLFALMWFTADQETQANDFGFLSVNGTNGFTMAAKRYGSGYVAANGNYNGFTSTPLSGGTYSAQPFLLTIAIGPNNPADGAYTCFRVNGGVVGTSGPQANPTGITTFTLGAPSTSGSSPVDLQVVAAYAFSPCPSLTDIIRVEQWIAGLGDLSIPTGS